ncbi:MAG: electron transport complex subunit RsxC [Oscillospiraceae bacterium]|jgi:electron transport complex protein RnfC|nr:electron transport complex subunit RsxC [Oscillospiraceae bacterium]
MLKLRRIKGVSPPHRKHTQNSPVEVLPVPKRVEIPMLMHSGKPAIPVVKPGEYVKVGQLIGELSGTISSPVHSSVSGTVKEVRTHDRVTGQKAESIIIESDGLQIHHEDLKPHPVSTLQEFLDAVRDSGAVGLGGAGFPAAPKLAIKNLDELDYILINGAECEPYVTSDTRTMVADTEHVVDGVRLLQQFMKPRKKIVICIEDNKPNAIEAMREGFKNDDYVEVRVLPTLYPQGERKVLVYNVTGRIVPEGARLADVGCLVSNCTTITVFSRYIKRGIPLISKVITVDGPIVRNPKNVLAPIGTPIWELFEFCGGFTAEPGRILAGGPMMGIALPDLEVPVIKTTNAILADVVENKNKIRETVCIKCGRCLNVCPMSLMPPNIETAYHLKDTDEMKKLKINMCVECGSCAYICPAKRPLVQAIQLSKQILWETKK